jgi:hypothetical protein
MLKNKTKGILIVMSKYLMCDLLNVFLFFLKALLPFFIPEYRPSIAETKDLNFQIFALIAELIKSDSHYLKELDERQFFVLLGYLLSEPRFARSNKWSHEAITILDTLSQSIYSCGIFLFSVFLV